MFRITRTAQKLRSVPSSTQADAQASAVIQYRAVVELDSHQLNGSHCETSSYINTVYYVTMEILLRCLKAGCIFCELLCGGLEKIDSRAFSMPICSPGANCIRIDHSRESSSAVRVLFGSTVWDVYRPTQGTRSICNSSLCTDRNQGFKQFNIPKARTVMNQIREPLGARTINRSDSLLWIGQRPDIVPDPDSDACFIQLRSWLSICQKEHSLCQAHEKSRFELPKRLINIRAPKCIRLCETSSLSAPDISYATLSHCWGDPSSYSPCVIQTHSLDEHLTCILWDKIPKTFRDAIIVTRRLGLKFLWIDSLCIIQDDLDNWAEESAKMSRIYANAVLTIAASAAENATQGFLGLRHSQEEIIKLSPENMTPIHIRKDLHSNVPVTFSYTKILLNTRGWVFQERLLSRRILYFEREETICECRSAHTCECGSDLPPLSSQPASLRTAYSFLYENANTEERYAWWRNVIVEQYSNLTLTKWTACFIRPCRRHAP
jgi:hypothetical protein